MRRFFHLCRIHFSVHITSRNSSIRLILRDSAVRDNGLSQSGRLNVLIKADELDEQSDGLKIGTDGGSYVYICDSSWDRAVSLPAAADRPRKRRTRAGEKEKKRFNLDGSVSLPLFQISFVSLDNNEERCRERTGASARVCGSIERAPSERLIAPCFSSYSIFQSNW